ncbi:MAG TPA: glycosyltransferase family 2 protein [Sedimentisphaerales bacterium]|nr:glycosyltransferase family 2 protein [Sedimentisphaerales bacterium]
MNVCIVLVTHNRLVYTRKTIARLLEDPQEQFDLYLWDNASNDETAEYLNDGVKDSRIKEVIISKENVGQTGAMNYAWSKTKTELIGKLDNDCLVTTGWTHILAGAHEDIDEFGALACWHYPLEEFDEKAARKMGKIQTFGNHQVLRHPWVCGSGFIMKRATYQEQGPWQVGCDVGTTYYFQRMALSGYINGFYYPLVLQEHMDDPKSRHCLVTDDDSLCEMYDVTYTLRTNKIQDMKARWARRPLILNNLNSGTWDVKYYVGWRAKLRKARAKMRRLLER